MSARLAVKAAQTVVKTVHPKLAVDGIWGRKSEQAYTSSPEAVQSGANKAAADLGYSLSELRKQALSGIQGKWNTVDFDIVLNVARKAGLQGKSLLNFMTTIVAESGAQNVTERGYSYSAAKRAFGARMNGVSENATPEDIFNVVYGGRMGNRLAGDGWKYRGRGYIQLTGRDNYSAFSLASGHDVVANPDMITGSKQIAAEAAVWYWKSRVVASGRDLDMVAATAAVVGNSADAPRRIALVSQVSASV